MGVFIIKLGIDLLTRANFTHTIHVLIETQITKERIKSGHSGPMLKLILKAERLHDQRRKTEPDKTRVNFTI